MTRIRRMLGRWRIASGGRGAVRRSERGVFVPLGSLVFLAVFSFIMILGIRTLLIKQAADDFRFRANQICSNLVKDQLFPVRRRALESFKQMLDAQFNNPENPLVPPGFVRLTDVRLSIPAMPDGYFDPIGGSSAPPYLDADGDGAADALSEVEFSALGLPSCVGIAGLEQDCTYSPLADHRYFPMQLWNNLEHAGQMVGCVFRGEVRVFFDWTESVTPVEAVYAYWAPVRGSFPQHDPSVPELEQYPGVTVAVSTHMTTDASHARFRFPQYESWELDDPLHGFAGAAAGFPNFYEHSSAAQCSGTQCLEAPERISPRFQSADWVDAQPGHEVNKGAAGAPSDYMEMRAACANPLTLVRNAFLTTVIELASRHVQLRSSLELLHVGTQNRNVQRAADLSSEPGLPTVMVPFGADLLRPDLTPGAAAGSYQLPYITFYGGREDGSDIPAGFGRPTNGFVNPFADSGMSEDWRKHLALIAGQLRFCHHLYQCNYDYEGGSPACPPQLISRIYPLNTYSAQLESPDYEPVAALRSTDLASGNTAWDQRCPWGGPGCRSGGGTVRPGNAGLTAAELVAALGSTQLCPYRHYSSELTPNLCEKPGFDATERVTNDLRPDYRALVSYLEQGAFAVRSPGLFPQRAGYLWPEHQGRPFADEAYVSAVHPTTPLLLVTHQPPSESDAQAVHQLLSGNSIWQQRPITVIFIPSGIEQASAVDRLYFAFRARSDGSDTNYHNRVYVISPYTEGVARWDMSDPDRDFQEYWLELISPGSYLSQEQSIMWRAVRIFDQLLLKNERKF